MTVFLGCGFAAKYLEGGGNFSVPLQWDYLLDDANGDGTVVASRGLDYRADRQRRGFQAAESCRERIAGFVLGVASGPVNLPRNTMEGWSPNNSTRVREGMPVNTRILRRLPPVFFRYTFSQSIT